MKYYTKSRRKMPTISAIRRRWAPKLWHLKGYDSEKEFIDSNACFACGMEGMERMERAHIKAKCISGSDKTDNLHMLCPTCHAASELLTDKAYWQWFKERTG